LESLPSSLGIDEKTWMAVSGGFERKKGSSTVLRPLPDIPQWMVRHDARTLRDHLRPRTRVISAPLRNQERYFTRLSIDVDPDKPGFKEARWITSEDVNVEHLLDVFTTIDLDSSDVWDACASSWSTFTGTDGVLCAGTKNWGLR